jgi:uncharacterized membrane protein YhiD involved in acid resistance
MKSWKTTLTGVLTILVALASAAKALLDGDPSTNPDFGAIIAAITAGIGLIAAKDSNVTGGTVPAA